MAYPKLGSILTRREFVRSLMALTSAAVTGSWYSRAFGAAKPPPKPRATVGTQQPTPPPAASITSFIATPATIAAGQPTVLSATVNGATSLTLDGAPLPALPKTVTPAATHTYTLAAIGAQGTSPASATTTVIVTAQPPSSGGPFTVGSVSYATLQAAFGAVLDGGMVVVKGGSLFNDQAGVLSRNNVTITTDTGTARFRKKIVNDKACFQITGNNTTLINIEFESMHSTSSGNGAGIRLEGKGLTLSNCKFIGCDDGILTNNATAPLVGGPGSVTIDHCLFDSCGWGDGQSHGIYIGYGLDSVLTLTNSTFQYTYVGHLVKTRSYYTTVDNCLFIKGTASRAIDACNGGHVKVTNSTFYQDPDMENPQFIGMGGDLGGEPLYPDNSFYFDSTNKVLDTSGYSNPPQPINTIYNNLVVSPNIGSAWPGNSAPPLPPRYPAEPTPLPPINSWANAPLQRWVEIANSRMDQLVPSINPNFHELAPGGFTNVMAAWNGAAFDEATGKFYLAGCGGHGAVNNGHYEYNAETFGWRIAMQPSSINATDYANSTALYFAAGYPNLGGNDPHHGSWDLDTGYYPPPGNGTNATYVPVANVWNPPGLIGPVLPTAQHSYGSICWVPRKGVIVLIDGPRAYDPVAGTVSYISVVPIGLGNPATPGAYQITRADSHTYWDAPSGKLYLMANCGYGYFNLFAYDPFTDARSGDLGGSNLYLWYQSQSTPIYGTRKMFFWNQAAYSAWIIDFSTNPPTPTAVPALYEPESAVTYNDTGLFGSDHILAICHCPQAGVVGLCASGRTVAINPDTGAVRTLDTGGTVVPRATLGKSGIVNGTWGRFRYYPARKALVLLSSTDENVRVMRME